MKDNYMEFEAALYMDTTKDLGKKFWERGAMFFDQKYVRSVYRRPLGTASSISKFQIQALFSGLSRASWENAQRPKAKGPLLLIFLTFAILPNFSGETFRGPQGGKFENESPARVRRRHWWLMTSFVIRTRIRKWYFWVEKYVSKWQHWAQEDRQCFWTTRNA